MLASKYLRVPEYDDAACVIVRAVGAAPIHGQVYKLFDTLGTICNVEHIKHAPAADEFHQQPGDVSLQGSYYKVGFYDVEEAKEAICKLNGHKVDGVRLHVGPYSWHKDIAHILAHTTPKTIENSVKLILDAQPGLGNLEDLAVEIHEHALCSEQWAACMAILARELSVCPKIVKTVLPSGGKPMDIRRALINCTQEEYEACEAGRGDPEMAARGVLNVAFLAYMFLSGLATESILHNLLRTLLECDEPSSRHVKSACMLLSIAGKQLSATQKPEMKRGLEDAFRRLACCKHCIHLDAEDKALVKDVLDMRAK